MLSHQHFRPKLPSYHGYRYTPGQRVHKCSYEGCDKMYDRRQSLINHEVFKHGRKRNPRPSAALDFPVMPGANIDTSPMLLSNVADPPVLDYMYPDEDQEHLAARCNEQPQDL